MDKKQIRALYRKVRRGIALTDAETAALALEDARYGAACVASQSSRPSPRSVYDLPIAAALWAADAKDVT